MKLKVSLFILMSIFSFALTDEDAAQMSMLKKMADAICVPNLPADKAKIVNDCENIVPKTGRDVFAACIKQSMGISEVNLPIFCYKVRPEADKLMACLKEREDEAAAHGIVIDVKQKEGLKMKYRECMAKAL